MKNGTEDPVEHIRLAAMEKIRRLQQSPGYRSFLSPEAIDAFANIKGTALAGKSLVQGKNEDSEGER